MNRQETIDLLARVSAQVRRNYVIAATDVRKWAVVLADASDLDAPTFEGAFKECRAYLTRLCAERQADALAVHNYISDRVYDGIKIKTGAAAEAQRDRAMRALARVERPASA